MLIKGATHNLIVRTRSEVALYVLNHKRAHLRELEERFRITITISADATVNAQVSYIIDRGEQVHTVEAAKTLAAAAQPPLTSRGRGGRRRARRRGRGRGRRRSRDRGCGSRRSRRRPDRRRKRAGQSAANRARERRRARRRPPAAPAWRGRGRGGEPREPREGAPQFTHETAPEHAIAHEDHDAGSPEEAGLDEQPPRQGGAPVGRRRRRWPPPPPARPPRRTPQPARPQRRGAVPIRQWRRTGAAKCSTRARISRP